MTDKEITREAQNLMVTFDAIASVSIGSLKTAIEIFHDTADGEAVHNQEFPIITAKVEFLQTWIRYQKERLTEAEKVADEILKLWNDRYGI